MGSRKAEPVDAAVHARAAIADGKGHCQTCGREVTCNPDTGIPARNHNREIAHNHQLKASTRCHGSRLPVREYAQAFDAAKGRTT